MVICENFHMWNMSLSQLAGYTPKIKFTCGKCKSYGEDRILMNAVKLDKPYIKCKFCGEINYIPITIK